ncbi:MAG: HIT domain-containing protein [Deltaproteobacteria bacterium]|nr:HIT domain-containing protein [Deltaproteobacteria bacterium]
MKRLWAPWRKGYLLGEPAGPKPEGCIFCALPALDEDQHRANLLLSVGRRAFLILNRYPYNSGHLMAVPRLHAADPSELSPPDYWVLAEVLRRATRSLRETLRPQGVNVGMNLGEAAGAGIAEHCHYHLVPRWVGDTNFLPVVGETKVLSIGLADSYDQLVPVMRDLVPTVEEELA